MLAELIAHPFISIVIAHFSEKSFEGYARAGTEGQKLFSKGENC